MLSYLREAYWRHSPPAARARARAAASSSRCALGLDGAPSSSLKSVWFSALRDMAQTRADARVADARLEAGREGPRADAGRDRLHPPRAGPRRPRRAGRRRPSSTSSSSASRTRIGRRQFAFVRPAISGDPREREAWFASLADVANRRREPWVLEGLRYLHHPLRAAASEKYIEPSLLLAARDPADRRHLLPEALDGRDAERPPVAGGRRHRPDVRRAPAAGLPRAAAPGHPVVGR